MAELRTIPVSWDLHGEAFRKRYPYGGGALAVWRLQPELAGRASLQFTDNPTEPGGSEPSFPIREGDVFTHAAKYVWVTIAAVPDIDGTSATLHRFQDERPFALLVVAPSACEIPVRTGYRGGGIIPSRASGTTAGSPLSLGYSAEVWHLSAYFFATGGAAPYLEVWCDDFAGGANKLLNLIVQANGYSVFEPARPFSIAVADQSLGPVAVKVAITGGTGTYIVNVGWRPSEGVLFS